MKPYCPVPQHAVAWDVISFPRGVFRPTRWSSGQIPATGSIAPKVGTSAEGTRLGEDGRSGRTISTDQAVSRMSTKGVAGLVLLLAAGVGWWVSSSPAPRAGPSGVQRVSRTLMGTLWSITVADHGRPEPARSAAEEALREVDRIEKLMSEWMPESPISQVNAAAGGKPVEVPAEVSALLQRALAYGARSGGAFDVSWRGMGGIWRFDAGFRLPSAAEVEAGLRNVDYRAVRLQGNNVSLTRPGMAIGLGGIAKGYAVDRAAAVLRKAGFPDSLVAGAGDIMASGTKYGSPWRLAVQDPRGERGQSLGTVALRDAAISTSGDYERFQMVGGVRYHHIMDPRTGWPARGSMSVSVLAPTAEQTDALATTLFVLGPEKGLALARELGVDALIIGDDGRRHATDGFAAFR